MGVDRGESSASLGPPDRDPRFLGDEIAGHVGCIVIQPDGSRILARAVPDPLAE